MDDRILVAIDASPDTPDDSLNRTIQFAKMTGGTVHLLHVARGHIVPRDISVGAGWASPPSKTTPTSGSEKSSRTPSTSWRPQASTCAAN